jgi:antitoxin component YwqK of YwqJK toxin-antitoxin module
MGVKYGYNYEFKKNIPDGKYCIYVNDTLEETGFFKNSLKDSIWVSYNHGEKEITTYKKDIPHGYFKKIYSDGTLETIMKYDHGVFAIRTHYYENGALKKREYFIKGDHVRIENYNTDGTIKNIDNRGITPSIKENSEGGKLNGEYELRHKLGYFKVSFKENKILQWQFLDKNGTLVMEDSEDQNK